MSLFRRFLLVMIVTTELTSTSLADAQAIPPSPRIANIWGGVAHEPDASSVTSKERAAGIALTPEQEMAATDEVETHCQRLLHDEGVLANSTTPNPGHAKVGRRTTSLVSVRRGNVKS
jgi:hypothetical protein